MNVTQVQLEPRSLSHPSLNPPAPPRYLHQLTDSPNVQNKAKYGIVLA